MLKKKIGITGLIFALCLCIAACRFTHVELEPEAEIPQAAPTQSTSLDELDGPVEEEPEPEQDYEQDQAPAPEPDENGYTVVQSPVRVTMDISSLSLNSLSFSFTNTTGNEYVYGSDFSIHIWKNDDWEPVKTIVDDVFFTSIGYGIPPNSTTEKETVDWSRVYGELTPGDYMFQKEVSYKNPPSDDVGTFYVQQFFTRSESNMSVYNPTTSDIFNPNLPTVTSVYNPNLPSA